MENMVDMRDFWSGRCVFLTGHTGFKGSWMVALLKRLGAQVHGYSLSPKSEQQSLFIQSRLEAVCDSSEIGDIRDYDSLNCAIQRVCPDIIIHMAAQPLVIESYQDPRATFDVNVMGLLNVFEAVRELDTRPSCVLNITTDKVYRNLEWAWPYRETDRLGGNDPYSSSKSMAELLTQSYKYSFLQEVPLATARSGNVIGGGDWADNRIIPDIIRCAHGGGDHLSVRFPDATRPWLHVLDPLMGYLSYAQHLSLNGDQVSSLNFAPSSAGAVTVRDVLQRASSRLETLKWVHESGVFKEAGSLDLDPSLAKSVLGWEARLQSLEAVDWAIDWYVSFQSGSSAMSLINEQIDKFLELK